MALFAGGGFPSEGLPGGPISGAPAQANGCRRLEAQRQEDLLEDVASGNDIYNPGINELGICSFFLLYVLSFSITIPPLGGAAGPARGDGPSAMTGGSGDSPGADLSGGDRVALPARKRPSPCLSHVNGRLLVSQSGEHQRANQVRAAAGASNQWRGPQGSVNPRGLDHDRNMDGNSEEGPSDDENEGHESDGKQGSGAEEVRTITKVASPLSAKRVCITAPSGARAAAAAGPGKGDSGKPVEAKPIPRPFLMPQRLNVHDDGGLQSAAKTLSSPAEGSGLLPTGRSLHGWLCPPPTKKKGRTRKIVPVSELLLPITRPSHSSSSSSTLKPSAASRIVAAVAKKLRDALSEGMWPLCTVTSAFQTAFVACAAPRVTLEAAEEPPLGDRGGGRPIRVHLIEVTGER